MIKLTLLIFMAIMLAFSLNAHMAEAQTDWYACKVDMTGSSTTGQTLVKLTDSDTPSSFTKKWFIFKDESKKEMLAIALTSIATNMDVLVYTNTDLGWYPTILSFFLGSNVNKNINN